MNPLTYETLLEHPETLDALHLRARRERARAINRVLFAPILAFLDKALVSTPAPKPRTRMLHRSATC